MRFETLLALLICCSLVVGCSNSAASKKLLDVLGETAAEVANPQDVATKDAAVPDLPGVETTPDPVETVADSVLDGIPETPDTYVGDEGNHPVEVLVDVAVEDLAPDNPCENAGGQCLGIPPPEGPPCPAGLQPSSLSGCGEDLQCCVPADDECYGPLAPCPEGEYCKIPTGSCDVVGVSGECFIIPEGCNKIYQPVCGCDGVTYGNECMMEAEEMSKDHDGECPGGKCIPEGESYMPWVDPGAQCCPELAPADDCCFPNEAGECECGDGCGVVCAACGNNECGPGENICNCPSDCKG